MSWSLNKNDVTPSVTLTESEQKKLNSFMGYIQNKGQHPKTAAENAGCEYKRLKGTTDQYEIYLSISNRATFIVDDETETVTMGQVGGHT